MSGVFYFLMMLIFIGITLKEIDSYAIHPIHSRSLLSFPLHYPSLYSIDSPKFEYQPFLTSSTTMVTSSSSSLGHLSHDFDFQLYGSNNQIVTSISSSISSSIDQNQQSQNSNINNFLSLSTARTILITVSALYGTNFGCVKILGDSLNPSVAALLRFTLAALVFSPDVIKTIKNNPKLIIGGLEVGLYSALGYYGQSQALLTSSASVTAFICSLAVIVVPILDLLFKKNELKKPWYDSIVPALIAVFGVGCLELGGSELPNIGDLWAFTQPIMFGFGFWRIEQHMKLMTNKKGEAQAFTGAMMGMVAICSIIWSMHDFIFPTIYDPILTLSNINNQFYIIGHDYHIFLAILWTGIVTTAITSYGENLAMSKLSASESTIIYSTEPLWGTAFAAFALHESIGWNTILGASLVISACMWSAIGPTLSIAGMFSSSSTSKDSFGMITEEIFENMMANWIELTSRLGFQFPLPPDL